MDLSRRHFLRMSAYGLGGAMLTNAIQSFSLSTALAQGSDYKALVCVFLGGGNDPHNAVVNIDDYSGYAQVRAASGLAIPMANLRQITVPSIGTFGLHPSMGNGFMSSPSLHTLYLQQKMAVVCNVGPLVQRMTRDEYRRNLVPKPYQLFSHSDQVNIWQTARADRREVTGWGGRIADRFSATAFPMVTSIAGVPIFSIGATRRPLSISAAPTRLNQIFVLSQFGTAADEVRRREWFDYLRTIDRGQRLVAATSDTTQQAIDIMEQLSGPDPVINTPFPNTGIGNQLLQVAKVIKANQTVLNLNRQIFFTSIGGFDTHQNQLNNHANLWTQVSQAVGAFYNATVELGVANKVTTFTLSDFGRTFAPAGSGGGVGTDHAWGSHHFVVGGDVRGGDFYGTEHATGTVFPPLLLGDAPGSIDTDNRGRFIPQTAIEQYAGTLARWYGVSDTDRRIVFPLIDRFPPTDLAFL